jgi:hypothetical protein
MGSGQIRFNLTADRKGFTGNEGRGGLVGGNE